VSKVAELGNFIRDQRRNARLSLRKLSNMAGISNPYLSQIERGLRRPSAEILQAIAKALRISAETLYVKAGILEERGDTADPVTAILRDLTLSEKQKQALVEVYQSFRHDNERGGRATDTTTARAVALQRASQRAAKTAAKPARARKPAKAKPAKSKPAKRAPVRGTKKATGKASAKDRKRATTRRGTARGRGKKR
jgi:transcriptional regulator with XRE-family HTH domain